MAEASSFVAEGVSLSGPDGMLVRDVSLAARPGQVVGITGPSGSGKTSLLLALCGLTPPDAGRILLGDRPVSLWREAAVGIVLQNLHLLAALTTHETVSLPMQARGLSRAEVAARTDDTLAAVGLADHAQQLISELSGGQRQRVAIARALAGQPDLILADEPTAALDPHWREVVLGQLWDAARAGAIVIIASSDPELIERCDEVTALT